METIPPAGRTFRAYPVRLLLRGSLVCATLLWPGFGYAQDISAKPVARSKIVPTFESLPHVALPHNAFKTWCGQKDRYLIGVDGQLAAYDVDVKFSTVAVSASLPIQCSADGQQLVYVDYRMGNITKVDIGTGKSWPLASYKANGYEAGSPVVSPDLRSIAAAVPLQLAAGAGDLKVVTVSSFSEASPQEQARDMKWSGNSSRLFAAYWQTIEVLDASGKRIGGGALPKGSYYRDGWFDADQQGLVLLLALNSDESGPGRLIKCHIADWKCNLIKARVDAISVGGRGVSGVVFPLGKPPRPGEDDDGGTVLYSAEYAVEIRDRISNVLARQTLATKTGRTDFRLRISPSGGKVVLTWNVEPGAECTPAEPQRSYCEQGMIADLSEVIR
jgi:hypothetical protein